MLRLHPAQLHGRRKVDALRYLNSRFAGRSNIEWIRSSYLALPVALSQCDLHITSFSTVVTEAAWMGIRSGITDKEVSFGGIRENYYTREKKSGMAVVIGDNQQDIEYWISKELFSKFQCT